MGKTTTAINLAYGLASMGRRVLLCDLDPQASLSMALGIDPEAGSLADVIGGATPGRLSMAAIIQPIAAGLDLAPAALDLAGCELGLTARMGRESVLKKALAGLGGYDAILLDCPPSLGLLVVNALTAAHGVIAPVAPDKLGLRGLALFLGSLENIKAELNPGLAVLGALVCKFERRVTLHQAALSELQAGGVPVLGVIGKSVTAAASAGNGQPIAGGDLAGQYKALALEVDKWLKTKPAA